MRTFWISGALLALTASCGSSSSGNDTAQDSGVDATLDVADASDASSETIVDATDETDAGAAVGKKITEGLLHGVTSDDVAIVDDGTSLKAAPLDGGTVQTIAPVGTSPIVFALFGKTALAGVMPTSTGPEEFWVWTSAHGAVKLATGKTDFEQFVNPVSPDETHVVYVANASPPTGDVTVANVDGTGVTTLLSGVTIPQEMVWAGDHYLLTMIPNAADGGTPTYTLSAFDANASFAKVDLATDAVGLGWTPHAASVAVRDSGGTLRAVPLDGSAPTLLDTGATLGTFMLDDATVIYATSAGALKKIAIGGGTPTTLVSSGFATRGDYFSPDRKTMIYLQPGSGTSFDLAVVGLDAPSTPVVLAGTTTTVPEALPQFFTADSTMIMFPGDTSVPVHTLYAAPISGAPIETIATHDTGARWGVGGAKIVFVDDADIGTATKLGRGTLKTVDLAGSAAPTTIVTSAGLFSAPTSDRKSLVYTSMGPKQSRADSAVYVAPIP